MSILNLFDFFEVEFKSFNFQKILRNCIFETIMKFSISKPEKIDSSVLEIKFTWH